MQTYGGYGEEPVMSEGTGFGFLDRVGTWAKKHRKENSAFLTLFFSTIPTYLCGCLGDDDDVLDLGYVNIENGNASDYTRFRENLRSGEWRIVDELRNNSYIVNSGGIVIGLIGEWGDYGVESISGDELILLSQPGNLIVDYPLYEGDVDRYDYPEEPVFKEVYPPLNKRPDHMHVYGSTTEGFRKSPDNIYIWGQNNVIVELCGECIQ